MWIGAQEAGSVRAPRLDLGADLLRRGQRLRMLRPWARDDALERDTGHVR
jgi:hypothetical protein